MPKLATAAILTAMCGSLGLPSIGAAASLPQVPAVSITNLNPTWMKMKKRSMKKAMRRRGGQAATPANPTPGR